MMHVAVLQVRLHVPGVTSLKDKRRVVKSILERARQRFGMAAAEVDDQDVHRVAVLGFAAVSGSAHHAREMATKLLDALRVHPEARVIEHELEVM
jgi:uncharacterized protein